MRYVLVISGLVLAMATPAAMAAQSVKVLVLTALQPETVVWLEHMEHGKVIRVASAYSPVWCDPRQVCVTQTGMGENNAATSVAALLASDELDLSGAIILRTGIAGAPIENMYRVASAFIDYGLTHPKAVQTAIESDTVERLTYPLSAEAVLGGGLAGSSSEQG